MMTVRFRNSILGMVEYKVKSFCLHGTHADSVKTNTETRLLSECKQSSILFFFLMLKKWLDMGNDNADLADAFAMLH